MHSRLVQDAIDIWQAGVDSVRGDRLVCREVSVDGQWLRVGDEIIDLTNTRRIVVVGAGKATAAMADGILEQLGSEGIDRYRVSGWINVPEGTFTPDRSRPIHYFAARPYGRNEPTAEAVYGTRNILSLVSNCEPQDLVLCLISGGGSALLCAPPSTVSLDDKIHVTRMLSDRGASIVELNSVRRALSLIKAGGLARACNAKQLITIILSDVLGDPIDIIASGPTFLDVKPNPIEALRILNQFDNSFSDIPHQVVEYLQSLAQECLDSKQTVTSSLNPVQIKHVVLGNNAAAVDASGQKAVDLGYAYWMQSSRTSEGLVDHVASNIALRLNQMLCHHPPDCLILGGEPTVVLPPAENRGLGGRNQQLALAVLMRCLDDSDLQRSRMRSMVFLSGGTDGEDGPTDAAGAWFDEHSISQIQQMGLQPKSFHDRCDAYRFFDQVGGLLKTGATNTNVCDLRIALIRQY